MLNVCFSFNVFSQGFIKYFGGNLDDIGYSVIESNDGGVVIAGETSSYGNGGSDVYLIKTDEYGDTLWTKTFGGNGIEIGYSVVESNDGGLVIAGETSSYGNGGSDVYLIKTDEYGDTLWTKTFGGNLGDRAYSIEKTNDGGYIIAGSTTILGNVGSDIYLIKTDEYGDTLWTKTFGGNSVGRDVAQTYDGGYIITGFTGINGGNPDAYLIKTNSIGDTLWTETYGSPGWDKAYSVIEVLQDQAVPNSGGYKISGYSDDWLNHTDCGWVIETDLYGGLKSIDIPIGNVVYSTVKTVENPYNAMVSKTGFTINVPSPEEIFFKSFGNFHFFGGNFDTSFGYSINRTSDGWFLLTGKFTNNSLSGKYKVYLIKVDVNGDINDISSIFNHPNPNRKLKKIVDLLGREIKPLPNNLFIEIFDDGTVEKKIMIE